MDLFSYGSILALDPGWSLRPDPSRRGSFVAKKDQ
jgi:hypothetical protein